MNFKAIYDDIFYLFILYIIEYNEMDLDLTGKIRIVFTNSKTNRIE